MHQRLCAVGDSVTRALAPASAGDVAAEVLDSHLPAPEPETLAVTR
jgi:hypothetical protein